ncbi:MAG: hypothetical protein PHS96_14895 [Anaerolineales bacterium]|nr:hypothetical protein [Anaerolineales bacterium]MDD5469077.1 hypothetical protein [Anaerolineales bacterium]
MKRMRFGWKQALAVGGVGLLAILVMDFNNRVADLRRLSAQKAKVEAQLEAEEAENVFLQTQIAEATAEGAVVRWAYEDGHMKMPGDNPVVPVPPPGSTPQATPTPAVSAPMVSNWQMWLLLFVDSLSP